MWAFIAAAAAAAHAADICETVWATPGTTTGTSEVAVIPEGTHGAFFHYFTSQPNGEGPPAGGGLAVTTNEGDPKPGISDLVEAVAASDGEAASPPNHLWFYEHAQAAPDAVKVIDMAGEELVEGLELDPVVAMVPTCGLPCPSALWTERLNANGTGADVTVEIVECVRDLGAIPAKLYLPPSGLHKVQPFYLDAAFDGAEAVSFRRVEEDAPYRPVGIKYISTGDACLDKIEVDESAFDASENGVNVLLENLPHLPLYVWVEFQGTPLPRDETNLCPTVEIEVAANNLGDDDDNDNGSSAGLATPLAAWAVMAIAGAVLA